MKSGKMLDKAAAEKVLAPRFKITVFKHVNAKSDAKKTDEKKSAKKATKKSDKK